MIFSSIALYYGETGIFPFKQGFLLVLFPDPQQDLGMRPGSLHELVPRPTARPGNETRFSTWACSQTHSKTWEWDQVLYMSLFLLTWSEWFNVFMSSWTGRLECWWISAWTKLVPWVLSWWSVEPVWCIHGPKREGGLGQIRGETDELLHTIRIAEIFHIP